MDVINKLNKILGDSYNIDINVKNSEWTQDDESLAKEYYELSHLYHKIHSKLYERNKRITKIFHGCSITSSLLTLLIFFINGNPTDLTIAYKVFGAMSTLFSLICATHSYEIISQKHKHLVNEFLYYNKNLLTELTREPNVRSEVREFIKQMAIEFERIAYESKKLGVERPIIKKPTFETPTSPTPRKRPSPTLTNVLDVNKSPLQLPVPMVKSSPQVQMETSV